VEDPWGTKTKAYPKKESERSGPLTASIGNQGVLRGGEIGQKWGEERTLGGDCQVRICFEKEGTSKLWVTDAEGEMRTVKINERVNKRSFSHPNKTKMLSKGASTHCNRKNLQEKIHGRLSRNESLRNKQGHQISQTFEPKGKAQHVGFANRGVY